MTHFLARSVLVLFATSALGATVASSAAAEPAVRVIPAVDRADAAPAELILAAHHRRHHAAATAKRHHKAAAQAASDEDTDGATAGAGGHVVEGEGKTYTVKRGDTLAKIADKLGVDVDDLKKANRIKGSSITAGQELKVPGGGSQAYVAAKGDNLAAIAKRFGVTEKAIRSANGLTRRARIKAGEKLALPDGAKDHGAPKAEARRGKSRTEQAAEETTAPEERGGRAAIGRVVDVPGPGRSYRVRKGDTLDKVADKLDVTVAELKRANHLRKSMIHPGQVLKAPGGATVKAYVVGPGDTIYTVAERFGVTAKRLRAENGLGRRGSIHTGQKLRLPAGYHDRGPQAGAGAEGTPPRLALPPSRPQPYTPPARPYVPPVNPPSSPTGAPQIAPAPSDAQISEMGRGRFVWPVQGQILSDFGLRSVGQKNDGINIRATLGQPVRAAAAGDVVYAGDQVPGFGNLVLIKHADGWVTAYGHLSKTEVRMQQKVTQGQEIGLAGATGGVSEPQLHFEVRFAPNPAERARPIDPKLVLPAVP